MGAQSLLIPFIQNRQEAEDAVKSIRYAPKGIRGMAGITRANCFGQVQDYAKRANEEICLLVQAETVEALENLEDIASVDGVFIGPADLVASMGFVGQPDYPDVVKACEDAIARLGVIGCQAGILTLNEIFSKRCIELGTLFTAVGVDLVMVVDGTKELRQRFNHV